MKHIIRMYEDAFRQHGDTHNAVLYPKGRQEERFHALTKHIRHTEDFSVLDYGCGLAHMKPYLDMRYDNVSYTGADAVQPFVEKCLSKYPAGTFYHVESPDQIEKEYDYIVSSGAFNILYTPDADQHREIVFDILKKLFEKTRVYLSVNFMTDMVDYRQPDTYHQSVIELYTYAIDNLSKRLTIDQSYMPYEYTLTVWKNQQIRRPENLYGNC